MVAGSAYVVVFVCTDGRMGSAGILGPGGTCGAAARPCIHLHTPAYTCNWRRLSACVTAMALCRQEGVEFIVAPYEADAQLAFLASIPLESGGVSAVVSEDSDLVAYGCRKVLFKFDRCAMCCGWVGARGGWERGGQAHLQHL